MDHRHERGDDARGVGVLIDVATVNEAVRTLCEIGGGFGENGFDGLFAATPDKNRAAGCLNDFVVVGSVVGGISLDHVMSISFAIIGGLVWKEWGPQYIFYMVALLSFVNLYVAIKVEPS